VEAMTGIERIGNILKHQPVDRIGAFEHFWVDTAAKWAEQGHMGQYEIPADHFGFDMDMMWAFHMVADLDFEPKVEEETEETILAWDGNGALFRRHKLHSATPEHVRFSVKTREDWEERIKPHLVADSRRIFMDAYKWAKQYCAEKGRFFVTCQPNVFELIHPVIGHEGLLFAMADDPEWVEDMVTTYANLIVELQEITFAEAGKPDGIWYYEDMGYRANPFMSPRMYREMIWAGHAKTFGFAHAQGLPVIVHSCGFVEPLLPDMIEAGMDCLQVMEVKAGMDPVRIHRSYGERIALMGGIDVRVLYSNDIAKVDAELEEKIPLLKEGYGYVLHSDHSIPYTVEHETYKHFLEKGLELGTY